MGAAVDTVFVRVVSSPPASSFSWPALATFVAAAIAGYIAWRQYVTARSKLKLDMFDKRFAVFQAAETFTYGVLADPTCPLPLFTAYNAGTTPAPFLFGADVTGHLEEMRNRALELRRVNAQLSSKAPLPHQARSALIQQDADLLGWFSQVSVTTQKLFSEYLVLPNPK